MPLSYSCNLTSLPITGLWSKTDINKLPLNNIVFCVVFPNEFLRSSGECQKIGQSELLGHLNYVMPLNYSKNSLNQTPSILESPLYRPWPVTPGFKYTFSYINNPLKLESPLNWMCCRVMRSEESGVRGFHCICQDDMLSYFQSTVYFIRIFVLFITTQITSNASL